MSHYFLTMINSKIGSCTFIQSLSAVIVASDGTISKTTKIK